MNGFYLLYRLLMSPITSLRPSLSIFPFPEQQKQSFLVPTPLLNTTMTHPSPKLPSAPPLSPSTMPKPSDYVYVRAIGPKSQHFRLESQRLRASNAFFARNMSSKAWHAQTREPRVLLVDADEVLLSIFVTFVRRNVIDLSLVGNEDPYMILFNAYRLGVFWNDDNFTNATIDAIASCALDKVPWSVMLPKMVWEVEPAESKLRALTLDVYVWLGGKEWLDPSVRDGLTGDFTVDLVKRYMDWKDKKQWMENPPFVDRLCEYHIHEEGKGCEHIKQSERNEVPQETIENEIASSTETPVGLVDTATRKDSDASQAAIILATMGGIDQALMDKKHTSNEDSQTASDPDTGFQAGGITEAGLLQSSGARFDNVEAESAHGSHHDTASMNLYDDRQRSETVVAASRLNTPVTAPESGDGDVFFDALDHEGAEQDDEQSEQAMVTGSNTTSSDTNETAGLSNFLGKGTNRVMSMEPLTNVNRLTTPMPLRAKTPLARSTTEPILGTASETQFQIHRPKDPEAMQQNERSSAVTETPTKSTIKQEKISPTKRGRADDDGEETPRKKKSPKKNGQMERSAGDATLTANRQTTPRKAAAARPLAGPKKEAAREKETTFKNKYSEAICLDD